VGGHPDGGVELAVPGVPADPLDHLEEDPAAEDLGVEVQELAVGVPVVEHPRARISASRAAGGASRASRSS
jgi:hypothetical protein